LGTKRVTNELTTKKQVLTQTRYRIVASRLFQPTPGQMAAHYDEHKYMPFFDDLVKRMSADKCYFFVIEGPDVVLWSRRVLGKTDPAEADVYSIRGSLATTLVP
jgi:nucleoside-diphosphate kinase